MKLRNKKTGKIVELDHFSMHYNRPEEWGQQPCSTWNHSLAELNEEWEDYKPKDPLIQDEKIRKAVRAWAEANNANVVCICALSGGWGVRHDWNDDDRIYSIDLLFKGNAPLGVGNQYTIAELCGEKNQ